MNLETRSGSRAVLRAVGSLWLAAVLLVLLLVAMAYATVFESARGTEQALGTYYHAWWFRVLLGLLAINAAAALVLRFPFGRRQVGFVLTHAGILVTLGGALVTHYFGVEGQISLADGQAGDHFSLDKHDALLVWNGRDQKQETLDLSRALAQYAHASEIADAPTLAAGGLRAQVTRYLPDSEWQQRVLNDNPASQPAIEVSLSPTGRDDPTWVFANQGAHIGSVHVAYRPVSDREEWRRLLRPVAASQAASKGTVKIEQEGATVEFSVEEGLERPVPLGDTGYTARVKRYLRHATVLADNQIVNAPDRPVNPYVEVELAGPKGTEIRRAFAKFPDFDAMHGGGKVAGAKVRLVAAADAAPTAPVEVLSGPDGDLHVRFASEITQVASRPIRIGEPVETPWPGRKFAVLRRYQNARAQWSLEPVEPVRAQRTPGIRLHLSTPAQSNDRWLQKHRSESFTVDGKPYEVAYTDLPRALGFSITLDHFRVGFYPGGERPRSFESHVAFSDPATGRTQSAVISMNHPASFGGYTFYQSRYRQEGGQSVSFLSVSRDVGQPIAFAGYIILIAGMLVVLITRMRERGRRVVNGQGPVGSALILAGLMAAAAQAAKVDLPSSLGLNAIRAVPVQHDGRWPPLDTLARDVVESVTGTTFYRGHDPVIWLLAWTLDPQSWRDEPLVSIRNAGLRAELQLPASKTVFSYAELANHAPLQALIADLARSAGDRKLNPLESKVSDLDQKLTLLERVFAGDMIRVIPDPKNAGGTWKPVGGDQNAKRQRAPDEAPAVSAAWTALRTAFLADDASAFATASAQLATALNALPAAYRPSPQLIATELGYNRLRPFRTAWMIMVVGAALALTAVFVRRRWFDVLAVVGLLAGFGVLTYGLWLRWQIAGRIPAANMFESLLFLSWGMGVFAILAMLVQRQRAVPLTASAMGALALILADCLPLDHFVRPIAPVLWDTIWMSIHVPIIMISYSVLALGVLIAHAQLLAMALLPRRRGLIDAIDALHYWYIHVGSILLLVGIVTGSMWAASSWGRYWGWDPKEVWSLVAFLGYMAILHVRIDRERVPGWMYGLAAALGVGLFAVVLPPLGPLTPAKLAVALAVAATMVLFVLARGQFATALKSVLAFWLIVMTYVGVNYVLGSGLHSYGFGTGAVARYMFLTGGVDLGLIALCCLVYLVRAPSRLPPSGSAVAIPG